jgi:hypothetical protein
LVRIDDIETTRGCLKAGITTGGRTHRVSFRSELPLSAAVGDALTLIALPAAMRRGENLRVRTPVSPHLLGQLAAIQDIYQSWDKKLRRIDVLAPAREVNPATDPVEPARKAISFTGGVDSFYSVLNTPGAALLFVHGLDIPLGSTALRRQVSTKLASAARRMDRPLMEMETNVRVFSDRYLRWQLAYGGVLAACALLLSRHLDFFGIPAGQARAAFQPDGAHPKLNPLCGTENVTVATVGCDVRRVDKVRAIAHHPVVKDTLRVCWENRGDAYNCGVCEKCLRTMAALEIFSALRANTTFQARLDYGRLSRAVALHRSTEMFIEENLEAARHNHADPALIKSLEKSLDPRRVWLFRLMHNKIPRLLYDRWYRIRRNFRREDEAC